MKHELNLKDELEQRKEQYIALLTNELKMAKRVMKNPRLKESAYKQMNFDSFIYYDYVPKDKEGLEYSFSRTNNKNVNSLTIKHKNKENGIDNECA
jgi:hypothetical protein